jgi:hypothetical protein
MRDASLSGQIVETYFCDGVREFWNGRRVRESAGKEWKVRSWTAAKLKTVVWACRRTRRSASATPWRMAAPTLSVRCHLDPENLYDSHGWMGSSSDSNVEDNVGPQKRVNPAAGGDLGDMVSKCRMTVAI